MNNELALKDIISEFSTKKETIVAIDETKEWNDWEFVEPKDVNLDKLVFGDINFNNTNQLGLWNDEEFIGIVDNLGRFGKTFGFPAEFVDKLSPKLQSDVINYILMSNKKSSKYNTIVEPYLSIDAEGNIVNSNIQRIVDFVPGYRDFLQHKEVCQVTYNIITGAFGQSEIVKLDKSNKGLNMRMKTNIDIEIGNKGRKKGDVLNFGIDVFHSHGQRLDVSLFTERLVCLNGMTSPKMEHRWRGVEATTKENQLESLMVNIVESFSLFEKITERAKLMSESNLEGDPEQLLIERARAMRLPQKYNKDLIEAWKQEQEPTEWGMLNAFTRFATHGNVDKTMSALIQQNAGQWTLEYDMVNAVLPRPIALSVGAHIINENN